jgi:hypothetical protein
VGDRRSIRERFFRQHPMCCFCGGTVAAAEIDHMPARTLFDERQWPEGYEFPACTPCNASSREDEAVLDCLVRLKQGQLTAVEEREFTKALTSLNRRRPELVQAIKGQSRNETKALLRVWGLIALVPMAMRFMPCAFRKSSSRRSNATQKNLARRSTTWPSLQVRRSSGPRLHECASRIEPVSRGRNAPFEEGGKPVCFTDPIPTTEKATFPTPRPQK